MALQPYLFFDGRTEEAVEFYRTALGAQVEMLMRFRDSPEPMAGAQPPADKVMHACFRVGDDRIFASDGNCQGKAQFEGFSIALSAKDEAQAQRWFDNLSAGGVVQQPLIRTFFSPRFGMVADRFGVSWMVMVHAG